MRCCATSRPVLQCTVSTVQNTEVDTFSSEPLLNFIVVEKLLLLLIKQFYCSPVLHCFFSNSVCYINARIKKVQVETECCQIQKMLTFLSVFCLFSLFFVFSVNGKKKDAAITGFTVSHALKCHVYPPIRKVSLGAECDITVLTNLFC